MEMLSKENRDTVETEIFVPGQKVGLLLSSPFRKLWLLKENVLMM